MESMSSNLNASLPLNVAEDAELTDRFKEGALAITSIFKHAQKSRKAAFAQGYHACVSDLRDYVKSNAEPDKPLTVGLIFDYLESRQSQLRKDLDATSANGRNGKAPSGGSKVSQAKSPSPSAVSGTIRQKSPSMKRPSPRPSNIVSSPPRVVPCSPSLSPTAFAEPAWSDLGSLDTPRLSATGWPEVSVLSALPVPPNALPSIGGKRKRDALVDVDPRNAYADTHHRRSNGNSRKRKGNSNSNKGRSFTHGSHDDWIMELDDEITGRERKRPRA